MYLPAANAVTYCYLHTMPLFYFLRFRSTGNEIVFDKEKSAYE